MSKLTQNTKTALRTYKAALLQDKAYRILRDKTADLLTRYDVNPSEWAVMGLLHEHKELQTTQLAHEMVVEAPYVTQLVNSLVAKKLAIRTRTLKDRRSSLISLTAEGQTVIPKIEKEVRSLMRSTLKGIPFKDVLTYINILEQIIKINSPVRK